MAAVAVFSPPAASTFMASRQRVPLANAPNAINSPLRPNHGKRTRSAHIDHRDGEVAPPPRKKLAIEASVPSGRRGEPIPADDPAANLFTGKPDRPISNSFNRKLANAAAVRESSKSQAARAAEKTSGERAQNEEQLRQWRRHYRRIFPQFIFYFESLPQEVATRASRHVARLGACDEKFFSRGITHVVTTREIPPDPAKADDPKGASSKTINPSLLDRSQESQAQPPRGRSILDAASQRRSQATQSMDVLQKARQMGLKIWPLEKFERMMNTLFDPDLDDDDTRLSRPQRASKETDLRQLIKNERNGHAPSQELVPFKGYYIYIHDMNERTKPVMLRDFPKPADGDDKGDWPRFHSVSSGRCPFVEEPDADPRAERYMKQEQALRMARRTEQLKAREMKQAKLDVAAENNIRLRTRSATRSPSKAPLEETEDAGNRMPKPPVPPTLSNFEPPKLRAHDSGNIDSMPPMLGSARANFHGITRNPGGEPMASGMQARNVTSAIRSQAISSQAAAPGARVGVSKEMHALSRRMVLSNNNSMPSSYMNDVRAAINQNEQNAASRRTTRQQKESRTLVAINEDEVCEPAPEPVKAQVQKTKTVTKKKAVKRDPKPGYCENCRDKYDDFFEHIDSKQHQKFALADDNFVELDDLLQQLART